MGLAIQRSSQNVQSSGLNILYGLPNRVLTNLKTQNLGLKIDGRKQEEDGINLPLTKAYSGEA